MAQQLKSGKFSQDKRKHVSTNRRKCPQQLHSQQPKTDTNLEEFINRKMNKQTKVHAFNKIKKQILIYITVDESQDHKKLKKAYIKEFIWYEHKVLLIEKIDLIQVGKKQ